MVFARVEINEYTNQVLNMIKVKFKLNDKSEALNKFVEICGDEFVEKEANDEYIKKVLDIEKRHFKKYGNRSMSHKELNHLFEMN